MTFTEILLPEFDQEMANTRKLLERVPDGIFEYQPHPKSMKLGALATHVALMPSWAKSTLEVEVLEIPSDYKSESAKNQAELLAMFDKGLAEARPKIEAASDDDWSKIWKLNYGGQDVFSLPRTAVMRGMVMNHMVHHRAQLGVYLRLNDVEIPGMYGPSADES